MSDPQPQLTKLQLFVELANTGVPLPSVAEQPVVVLYDWQVVETPTGEWFLSGIDLGRGRDTRRASTAVVSFKPRTGIAVTASGRVYRLHGHRAGYGAAGPLDRVLYQHGMTSATVISERVERAIRAARFGRRKSQRSHRSHKHRSRPGAR
jgi:hypothetical protein